jgi:hypothetical protein
MTDAYSDQNEDGSENEASDTSPWRSLNLQNPGYGDDPYSGNTNSPQTSSDPLAQRLGQVMRNIVSDPYGVNDFDPATDPWVPLFRGPPLNPTPPSGLLMPQSGYGSWASSPESDQDEPFVDVNNPGLDFGLASSGDGDFIPVGVQAKLRRQWSQHSGLDWPKTEDGRNYDISHKLAKADGGTDAIHNIEPMHPDLHRQMHMDNGDFARWARRRWAPRAAGAPGLNALGWLGIIPGITGLLSGRIRTDKWENTTADLLGVPSADDLEQQRLMSKPIANLQPGQPWV